MPRFAPLIAVPLAAGALLAGCGDTTTVQVTVTVHTGTGSTTSVVPPVTTPTTPTTGTTTEDTQASLELRMPAQDIIPSLKKGTLESKPTASSMVTALYSANDPTIPAATSRLLAAGYEDGVLRDQRGENDQTGITLMRTYIYRLRDKAAAQAEVDASATELRGATTAPITEIQVPDVPGAKALRITPTLGGQKAVVLYISFAAGRDVYGMQAFARAGAKIYQPQILELAASLYRAWNTSG
ncbi:MAG: hypothetical protein U0237_12995 [Thermoleophilia bacterium]